VTTADPTVPSPDCFRCGYDLRGISDDHPCPECGLLAERSRRQTDELHESRPKWLRSISRGVILILLAIAMLTIWGYYASTIAILIDRQQLPFLSASAWGRGNTQIALDVNYGIIAVAEILLIMGVLFLTHPEGYEPADRADRWRRRSMRAASVFPLIASVVLYYVGFTVSSFNGMPADIGDISTFWLAMALLTLGVVPLILLLFSYLRAIAKRARSAHLAEHCNIVAIGTASAYLYALGVLIFEIITLQGTGRYWDFLYAQIYLTWGMALVGLFFGTWSLYLLTRFAISFTLASRHIRRQWKHADRAVQA
jgi:hypothetical protein